MAELRDGVDDLAVGAPGADAGRGHLYIYRNFIWILNLGSQITNYFSYCIFFS